MAIVRKEMTPDQFDALLKDIEDRLENIHPLMDKFGRRYQKALRRNIYTGRQATGAKMPPLTEATLNAIVTDNAKPSRNERQLGRRRDYGDRPMLATGKMVKNFVYRTFRNGFVLLNKAWTRSVVSGYHLKPVDIRVTMAMSKHLAEKHDLKVKPGTVMHRPERIPFALNSRMVKRSVGDLNKYIFKALFGG